MDAQTLSAAMGQRLSLERYEALLPAFNAALIAADCTTVQRVAMWCAQVGHESGGLQWMEEIASGAAYEGRTDLGNVYPGDGTKYKGHGPIQITGRYNTTLVSRWAAESGYITDPLLFVGNPELLGSDEYGFLGVVWYWTVARNMNSYADNGDIYGATRAVNGGLNGIDDRVQRWNWCLNLGDALLPTGGTMAGVTFVNYEGNTVDEATFMRYADERIKQILEQLAGPHPFDGWPQLGNRTIIDALAAIGEKLGIDGFKAPVKK